MRYMHASDDIESAQR